MANYKLLKRLERIIYLVNTRPGISKSNLLEQLLDQTDNEVSERTLERDFNILKNDYGLDICYDRANNGYHLDDDPERLEHSSSLLNSLHLLSFTKRGLKIIKPFKNGLYPMIVLRLKAYTT